MQRFLGWDCANKTLGWSCIDMDLHICEKMRILCLDLGLMLSRWPDLKKAFSDENFLEELVGYLDIILYFYSKFITYLDGGVIDVLDGKRVKDVDKITRAKLLHKHLVASTVNASDLPTDAHVIIEHQNKIGKITNEQSTAVSNQLVFYYINHKVDFINPKLKNNIALSTDLTFERFLSDELGKTRKTTDLSGAKYTARKRHAKANFLYLIKIFNCEHIIIGVKSSVLDDMADSTMEILAYALNKKLFM